MMSTTRTHRSPQRPVTAPSTQPDPRVQLRADWRVGHRGTPLDYGENRAKAELRHSTSHLQFPKKRVPAHVPGHEVALHLHDVSYRAQRRPLTPHHETELWVKGGPPLPLSTAKTTWGTNARDRPKQPMIMPPKNDLGFTAGNSDWEATSPRPVSHIQFSFFGGIAPPEPFRPPINPPFFSSRDAPKGVVIRSSSEDHFAKRSHPLTRATRHGRRPVQSATAPWASTADAPSIAALKLSSSHAQFQHFGERATRHARQPQAAAARIKNPPPY